MNFTRTILPNGIRVLTIPMPSFESATVLVMVGAGSRYETKQNNGISHFLEHMAFKGTTNRPSALAISSLIDGLGGEFNAFTSKEVTGFYIKSSKNHIDVCMDVLSDMLSHSLFKPEEIDKERGVILEEINLYEDTPIRKIGDIYESLLYGDTPLGWDTAGQKDVIRKLQRDDFINYMDSLYSADNITVVLAGGFEQKKASDLVEKFFSGMKKFKIAPFEKIAESQKKPQIFVKHKKTEQAHIALGVRTVSLDDPKRYPLMLLAAILGGGMSSRLFHEVRERRGLAYYVRTSSDSYQDCGSLVTMAGVDSKRIDDSIKVILQEYEKITRDSQISAEELKKAKEFIKGHMVLELEDSRAVAGFYGSQELLEKVIDNPPDVITKIEKVTADEISEVSKKFFTEKNLNLAVIGNFTDGQKLEKLLRL